MLLLLAEDQMADNWLGVTAYTGLLPRVALQTASLPVG